MSEREPHIERREYLNNEINRENEFRISHNEIPSGITEESLIFRQNGPFEEEIFNGINYESLQRPPEWMENKKILFKKNENFILKEKPQVWDLRKRFLDAGFSPEVMDDVEWGIYSPYFRKDDNGWPNVINDNALKLLARVTNKTPAQRAAVGLLVKQHLHWTTLRSFSETLNEASEETDTSAETERLLKEYMATIEPGYGYLKSTYTEQNVLIGVQVIANKFLFSMFGNDIRELNRFEQRLASREVRTSNILDFGINISKLVRSPNASILFEGLDYHVFETIEDVYLHYGLSNPEMAKAFNEFLKSDRDWTDKIAAFKKIMRAGGLKVRDGAEKDEATISIIRRRESPNNPLVTTGLVTTVGPEIEYPKSNPVAMLVENKRLYEVLQSIGFKRGGGDQNFLDEASPGPFYSPETANLIFQLYSDSGIVNTRENLGMNLHFNVGTLIQDESSQKALVTLVRGLYLTGAAYDPFEETRRIGLHIYPNGDHWEAKVFDITTDKDNMWNFNAASYLTWAIKAQQDKGKGLPGEEWREQLASLWNEYQAELQEGLAYLGKGEYLHEIRNRDLTGTLLEHVVWHNGQLKKIWKDENYYRLPNLKAVGQKGPDTPDEDGIEGVMFRGQWYPNIAIFARTVTDRIVGKIEDIANRVEDSCRDDIRRIDAMTGKVEKRHAIRDFVKKYGLKIDNPDSRRQREHAYGEVRDLMFATDKK